MDDTTLKKSHNIDIKKRRFVHPSDLESPNKSSENQEQSAIVLDLFELLEFSHEVQSFIQRTVELQQLYSDHITYEQEKQLRSLRHSLQKTNEMFQNPLQNRSFEERSTRRSSSRRNSSSQRRKSSSMPKNMFSKKNSQVKSARRTEKKE